MCKKSGFTSAPAIIVFFTFSIVAIVIGGHRYTTSTDYVKRMVCTLENEIVLLLYSEFYQACIYSGIQCPPKFPKKSKKFCRVWIFLKFRVIKYHFKNFGNLCKSSTQGIQIVYTRLGSYICTNIFITFNRHNNKHWIF